MHHCQIPCNFRGIDDLCKLGKEYLIALTCKLCISFKTNSETFDVLHAFQSLVVAKLYDLKTVRFFFWPTLYYCIHLYIIIYKCLFIFCLFDVICISCCVSVLMSELVCVCVSALVSAFEWLSRCMSLHLWPTWREMSYFHRTCHPSSASMCWIHGREMLSLICVQRRVSIHFLLCVVIRRDVRKTKNLFGFVFWKPNHPKI